MEFTIKSIIVWSRRLNDEPRVIAFSGGKLNILTGPSRSGKSALLWIVDFCLGSSHCHIPTGKIRDNAEAFGLVVANNGSNLLLTRDLDSNMSFADLTNEDVPRRPPKPNISVSNFKQALDTRLGLPFLEIDESTARPGFRDMMAFCLQPQHIVANPYTLFYRTDRTQYRERLQRLMPFVLGIDSAADLAMRARLDRIDQEIRSLKRDIALAEEAASSDLGRLRGFTMKAVDLGLLDSNQGADLMKSEVAGDYIKALGLMAAESRSRLPRVSPKDQRQVTDALARVAADYDKTETEIRSLKRRRNRLEEFSATAGSYGTQVADAKARLESVNWFSERLSRLSDCPFCGERGKWSQSKVQELLDLANTATLVSESWRAKPALLDREIAAIEDEIAKLIRHEASLKTQLEETKSWEEQSAYIFECYRFLGFIDMFISSHNKLDPAGPLIKRLRKLEEDGDSIRRRIQGAARRKRHDAQMAVLAELISHYSRRLGLERADQVINLDLRELTLRFSISGEDDGVLLADVGSGANHMGYHAAALFALHELFVRINSSVPSFLIMDQPSQVFFPHKWPEGGKGEKEIEAIENMKNLFSVATTEFLARVGGCMQLIVLDHVGPDTWQHVQGVEIVENERWWDGHRLIPDEWMEN